MKLAERVPRVEVGRPGRRPLRALRRAWARRARAVPPRSRPAPGAPRRRRHHELDLDAVADHAGERLGDQRAVAALEPVLGEGVGHGDPEPLVVHLDELGVTKPRLEVGRRQRHLQLSKGRAPDLLRVHPAIEIPCASGSAMGSVECEPERGDARGGRAGRARSRRSVDRGRGPSGSPPRRPGGLRAREQYTGPGSRRKVIPAYSHGSIVRDASADGRRHPAVRGSSAPAGARTRLARPSRHAS